MEDYRVIAAAPRAAIGASSLWAELSTGYQRVINERGL